MGRVIIGAAAGAIAMFIIGFIFYATPLYKLGTVTLDNAGAAAVQRALASNLPKTGTYFVPSAETPQQTVMYGRGPIATIHYNVGGFSVADPAVIIGGLALDFVVALLIGFGLLAVARRAPDFASRARLVVCFSVAATLFMHIGQPIWYHYDWSHFLYLFVADTLALAAAGLIIARWFLPQAAMAPEGAPTEV